MTGIRKNLVLFSTTVSLILGLLLEKSDRDAVCKSLGSPACFAVASPGSAWSQWPSFFSVCTRCRERSSKSAEKHCYKLRFSLKVKATQSCPTLCDPMDYTVHGILQARILVWVAFPFSRGSSQPRDGTQLLPRCRRILYQLSHQGSPRILEWAASPFSSRFSRPRDWIGVSCIAVRLFTSWATRE